MSESDLRWASTRRKFAIALLIFSAACRPTLPAQTPDVKATPPRIANLHAFARLYGVVRWFHPSDAAAAIDWNQFAIDGARRMIDAPDIAARRSRLIELFAPIAPTVHIAAAGEAFPDEPALRHATEAGLDLVAWEHKGYGDSTVTDVYASKRRHRDRIVPVEGFPYGALWQAVDATPYRGAQVRLRGKLRTATPARGQLWIRVDRPGSVGFFDNMNDRPVASRSWEAVELTGAVDTDATRIVFGMAMSGTGTVWYDDIDLAVQNADGEWRSIEIKDPGFESRSPLTNWNPGLARPSGDTLDGWDVSVDPDRPASGAVALRMAPATRVASEELFADAPRPGETVDIDLGDGLRARVPLTLYSKDGQTIGDDHAHARRSQTDATQSALHGFDVVSGVADIVVAWNVLEHFWPYWDVVNVDWLAELDVALRDALDDLSLDDHIATLQRLSAAAPDGHARVACPGRARRARPPFIVDIVEGHLVVTASADPAVVPGDMLISADGRPATAQLADDEALASGSQQFRRVRARVQFGSGPIGSVLALRILRSGVERNVMVARSGKAVQEFSHPAIEQLSDGTYYVDLVRASMGDIDAVMKRLASAPAVVFDVRGHPNGNHRILSHLLARPDDSKTWLAIPHVIRPDHLPTSVSGWETEGWELPVLEPHIGGRVAFLISPDTASYGESVMGLVEYYHLGAIIGSTTAGANGNIAQIAEPTGCSSVFTGLRVTKSDGSQFHLVGIKPTIPASRTIAGVAAGRDEVLEKALAYVRDDGK